MFQNLQWVCVQLFLLQFDCVYKSLLDDPNILEIVFDDADEVTETFLLTLQVLHTTFKQTQSLTRVTNSQKNIRDEIQTKQLSKETSNEICT